MIIHNTIARFITCYGKKKNKKQKNISWGRINSLTRTVRFWIVAYKADQKVKSDDTKELIKRYL